MKTKFLILLSVVGLMVGCDLRRKETSQKIIDSLRSGLQASHRVTQAMVDVGVLIDSIDANRKVLRANMVEGTSYVSYVARMRDINQYVRRTQRKIEALEKTARHSTSSAYAIAIKKLKGDLEARNHELTALKEQVSLFKLQNADLVKMVNLQDAEIKQEETAKLEEQVKQLLVKSKLDEGEAYFARAAAVEETASRTKFAPRKKKESIKKALELYKLAQFYGMDKAEAKVSELEKKLGTKVAL